LQEVAVRYSIDYFNKGRLNSLRNEFGSYNEWAFQLYFSLYQFGRLIY